MPLTRRQFVALTAPALITFGSATPRFLAQAAEKSKQEQQENILVVLQLSGGNDGLNTIVPYQNDDYHKARPTLGLQQSDVLKINDELGFHPAANGLHNLLQHNRLAIVQGVGYPNPNLSHFESMDIWHTCLRKTENRPDGWLGRTVDHLQQQQSRDVPALHLGQRQQPFALTSREHRVPSVKSLEQFRLDLQRKESLQNIRDSIAAERGDASSLLNFVQSSTGTALDVSQKLLELSSKYTSSVTYPDSSLGSQFKLVAQLIDANLATRIFYLEIDGFDTHSQQGEAHAALLRQVGDALNAFVTDLDKHGHGDRVVTLCFSEFGRRVEENASKGTDHGQAAPLFLAGNKVKAGLIGDHPALDQLDNGDLRHHTDFRQVYASLLQNWFNTPADEILLGKYQPLDLLQPLI